MTISNSSLHSFLVDFAIENGYAPDVAAIARSLHASEGEASASLQALAEDHGVVLHPGSDRIWVLHPFAFAPTNFLLRSGKREWWANCAWCALGAAHLLDRDLDIVTTLGADGRQVTLHVVNGRLIQTDFVVHFPVAMRDAWQNVIYTCSVMLLFENAKEVERWSERHHITIGDVQPIETVWEFARVWYGNHRNPQWKKWTSDEAREIFARFGLTGSTWELPSSNTRF